MDLKGFWKFQPSLGIVNSPSDMKVVVPELDGGNVGMFLGVCKALWARDDSKLFVLLFWGSVDMRHWDEDDKFILLRVLAAIVLMLSGDLEGILDPIKLLKLGGGDVLLLDWEVVFLLATKLDRLYLNSAVRSSSVPEFWN